MHIDDLRRFAMLWLHKSEEVRADKEHYATNITGDVYASGWISEMYGYSFAAAEVCMVMIYLSPFCFCNCKPKALAARLHHISLAGYIGVDYNACI